MTTDQRLEELERRATQAEKMIKIIGRNMSEFDFDALLDDVETEVEVKEEVVEVVEEVEDEISAELDDLLDTIPEPAIETKPEPVVVQIEELTYDQTGVEFADESIRYAKDMQTAKLRMTALKQEMKTMKDEAADQGVDIKAMDRAASEVARELKETPDEAKSIESMKDLLRKDDSWMVTQVGING